MFDFRDSLKSKARRLQRISQVLQHNEHEKNTVLQKTSDVNFERGVTHYYSRLSLPGATHLESSTPPDYEAQRSQRVSQHPSKEELLQLNQSVVVTESLPEHSAHMPS